MYMDVCLPTHTEILQPPSPSLSSPLPPSPSLTQEHLNVPVDDFFSDAPPLSPPSPSPLSSSAVPDGMSSTGPNDEPVQLMLREPETIASKEATVAGGAEEKKGSGGKQRLQWKDKNKKKKQKGKKPQPQKPKKKQEHKSAEQKVSKSLAIFLCTSLGWLTKISNRTQ